MKRIIQLILFFSLIAISLIVHRLYFQENDKKINTHTNISTEKFSGSENNLIKDLRYEVKLDIDNEYIIIAELGELIYENDVEKVKMQIVIATLIDKNKIPITIKSNKALYDNSNYDTNFSENVKIEYMGDIIFSDKVDLEFKNNIINIYDNVVYNGTDGVMKADYITINLITKKINVNMKNKKNNIKIIVK
jgi:lipopolysaccharide assembly outer membrane protein LptD (OstA)|tara:strand:- start:57 stop:632 length:576 start_codon:yes stop_codon:yes gene_type:complete